MSTLNWARNASVDQLRRTLRNAEKKARELADRPLEVVLAAEKVACMAREELRSRTEVPALLGGCRHG
jgi:hypothetical protein